MLAHTTLCIYFVMKLKVSTPPQINKSLGVQCIDRSHQITSVSLRRDGCRMLDTVTAACLKQACLNPHGAFLEQHASRTASRGLDTDSNAGSIKAQETVPRTQDVYSI